VGSPVGFGSVEVVNGLFQVELDFGAESFDGAPRWLQVAALVDAPAIILHEVGHYFDLCHTQGCSCADCAGELGTACTSPGDDDVPDTLQDVQCWDLDDISLANFFVPLNSLPSQNQLSVVNVAYNLRSYHHLDPLRNELSRLTEGQLDRWTGTLRVLPFGAGDRLHVVDGATFIVPADWSLLAAHNTAGANDIVLIKPGVYVLPANSIFFRPATYRATRAGAATLIASP